MIAAATKTTTIGADALVRPLDEAIQSPSLTPAPVPGPGTAPRWPRPRPPGAPGRSVVAGADGLDDDPARRPASRPRRSHGTWWPACPGGCRCDVLGGCWSNGMPFLLTVIPISSRRCSASLPVTPSGVTSTSMRWLSVPPDTTRAPSPATVSARTAALVDGPPLGFAERLLGGQLERDGLGGDDLHQRPALDAREHGLVDALRRATP